MNMETPIVNARRKRTGSGALDKINAEKITRELNRRRHNASGTNVVAFSGYRQVDDALRIALDFVKDYAREFRHVEDNQGSKTLSAISEALEGKP
jgi:hypothetical protein